ncbi:hypothetical protein ES705_46961 [subsurface metagenome]
MIECPFINDCAAKLTEKSFKAFCQVGFFHFNTYKDCADYQMKKYGKPTYQEPRKWKKKGGIKT